MTGTLGSAVRTTATYLAVIAAGTCVVAYSQMPFSNHGDEWFHLLIAKLTLDGRTMYSDFFYQHPPLFPLLTAAWMRAFGPTWRAVHWMSGLLTAGSMLLCASAARTIFEKSTMRNALALTSAVLFGLSLTVFKFGVVGQPFGLCLYCAMAALWCVLRVERAPALFVLGAGVALGVAVGAYLLAAPVALAFLGWTVRFSPSGDRSRRAGLFLAGMLVVIVPALVPAYRHPAAAWFDLVEFQLWWREGRALPNRAPMVVKEALASVQTALLVLLAAIGILRKASRDETVHMWLCAASAGAAGLAALFITPTFDQYFLIAVPFVAILAAMGLDAILGAVVLRARPLLIAGVLGLYLLAPAQFLRASLRATGTPGWTRVERVASYVLRTRSAGATFYSSEPAVYFASGIDPAPGLEGDFKPELPEHHPQADRFVRRPQVNQWLNEGRFDVVVLNDYDVDRRELDLGRAYAAPTEIEGYEVYTRRVP